MMEHDQFDISEVDEEPEDELDDMSEDVYCCHCGCWHMGYCCLFCFNWSFEGGCRCKDPACDVCGEVHDGSCGLGELFA